MKYREGLDLNSKEYSYGVDNNKDIEFLLSNKKMGYGPSREYLSIFKGVGSQNLMKMLLLLLS